MVRLGAIYALVNSLVLLTLQLDNLAHCSYESGILEKPDMPAPKDVWTRTVGMHTYIVLDRPRGLPWHGKLTLAVYRPS